MYREIDVSYYVNDPKLKMTILTCRNLKEALVYASWANEVVSKGLVVEEQNYGGGITGDVLLSYYGFTIDSVIDLIFSLVPNRSRIEGNKLLLKYMLSEPNISKSICCQCSNKNPEHYSRLSRMIGQQCLSVSRLTGGRNPMKLLRGIRGDL